MRKRVMALTVAAVIAAMMVAGPAGPAFAAPFDIDGVSNEDLRVKWVVGPSD